MKKSELKQALKLNSVPEYYYNIDGTGEVDQKVCLENINSKWSVYYCERGKKFDECIFNSEEEACQNIYERLVQQ